MQCYAHILILIVYKGLKEVDDSIVKVCNLVMYLRAYSISDKIVLCSMYQQSFVCITRVLKYDGL